FGEEIKRRFSEPLVAKEEFTREENKYTYIADTPHLMNHLILQENLVNGESVKRFTVSILTAKSHTKLTIYEGQNIGHKAIIQVPTVKAKAIIVEVTEYDDSFELEDLQVYHV